MSDKKTQKNVVSCGAVVYREHNGATQILLVRPSLDRDVWGIPKGHVDKGETLEQTALRETLEETGLHVAIEDKLPECSIVRKGEHKRVVTWMARQISNDQLRTSDPDGEIVDARFFDVDALPNVHAYQKSTVAAAASLAKQKIGEAQVTRAMCAGALIHQNE
jgi:ADP-ribose pyrophosphatase YjhB (NUDIX family)